MALRRQRLWVLVLQQQQHQAFDPVASVHPVYLPPTEVNPKKQCLVRHRLAITASGATTWMHSNRVRLDRPRAITPAIIVISTLTAITMPLLALQSADRPIATAYP